MLAARQGQVDKEKVWREAEQLLRELGQAESSSLVGRLEKLTKLLALHPWLRERRRFSGRGVSELLRVEASKCPEVVALCREARLRLGDLPPPQSAGPRVLALDGGGMRGVVSLVMLQELEQRTGRPVHQLFDLIVGTSTGAILAAMLGLRKVPATQCLALYRELGEVVFGRQSKLAGAQGLLARQSYYSDSALETLLQRRLGPGASLQVPGAPLVALVATDVTTRRIRPHLFCNYVHPPCQHSGQDTTRDCSVVAALMASTAAPGYFPAVQLAGRTLQDGGIVANNPSQLALLESRSLWPGLPLQCLLSVGSGRSSHSEEEGDGGLPSATEKVSRYVESLSDTEGAHSLLAELLDHTTYFRLNPHLDSLPLLHEVNPKVLERIQQDTRMYIRRNKFKLGRLEKSLLRTPSVWDRCVRGVQGLRRRWHV